jgi:hypothetical protein
MGALHESALTSGHVVVEKDVKSVFYDHISLCPLLAALDLSGSRRL